MDAAGRAARPTPWGADALWRRLEPLLPGLSVEVLARVESTNTLLIERARRAAGARRDGVGTDTAPGRLDESTPFGRRAGDTQPALLVAEQQTRGRGRMGRTWQSTPGCSLTFSLALMLDPVDWSGLSLSVGAAIADALDPPVPASAPRIGLKWPNDLWLRDSGCGGRKLGGILVETVVLGARRMAVVGVGLNVLPQPVRDVSQGFACLGEIHPGMSAPAALDAVAEPLVRALLAHESAGFPACRDAFVRRDVLAGQRIVLTGGSVPGGVAVGVDADGALLVQDDAGAVRRVAAGEVSVHTGLAGPGAGALHEMPA